MGFKLTEFNEQIFLFDFVAGYQFEAGNNTVLIKTKLDYTYVNLHDLYAFCDFLIEVFGEYDLSRFEMAPDRHIYIEFKRIQN